MKLFTSFLFAASFAALALACTASTSEPAPVAAPTEALGSDPGTDTGTSEDELKKKKKKTCAAAGGSCVGLSPASCQNGYWADATKVSCGGGLGTGCCIECPVLSPPAPGLCDGATPKPIKDEHGCVTGYECPPAPPPPPPGPVPCEDLGGQCVGLAPVSCPSGRWATVNQASCGPGIGTGCCLPSCPELVPLPPSFCDGGPTTPVKDASGCIVGFDCK